MRKFICVIACIVMMLFMLSCCAESIVVMDEYDILTPDEVLDGVQLDPDTMFAYRVLDDDTIMLVRYCWFHSQVDIPETIAGKRVSVIGSYAFDETGVKDVFLSHEDIIIDDGAFDYTNATIWVPAGHPTLRIVTGLMRKEDASIEYYADTEYAVKFRYYLEFD